MPLCRSELEEGEIPPEEDDQPAQLPSHPGNKAEVKRIHFRKRMIKEFETQLDSQGLTIRVPKRHIPKKAGNSSKKARLSDKIIVTITNNDREITIVTTRE